MSNIRPLRSMLPVTERVHSLRFAEDLQKPEIERVHFLKLAEDLQKSETEPVNFFKFAEDLQKSDRRSLIYKSRRYQKVSVLAFDWSNDEMGVQHFRDDLLRLFREDYGFETETYVLNARDPSSTIAEEFESKLRSFRMNRPANIEAKHLLIYYYSGHSDSGPKQDQLKLGGRVDHGKLLHPHLDWYRFAETALSVPGCETLLIMDSCNSAMANIDPDGEILTAAGRESVIPAGSGSGLTKMLIEEIYKQGGRDFTACDLHANLLTKALKENANIAPIHKTPAHFTHTSVLFHMIRNQDGRKRTPPLWIGEARALMRVSIDVNTLPTVEDSNRWQVRDTPSEVKIIQRITNGNGSTRTMLVSLPIQIWDYLKDERGYNFVSFILGDMYIRQPFSAEPVSLASRSFPAPAVLQRLNVGNR